MTDATQVLTAETTAEMVRCGVNIIGFDQLQPFDGRLDAMVWSWARNEPSAGGGRCALRGADSRFVAARCSQRARFACVDSHLDWHVTAAVGPWSRGVNACEEEVPGSQFGAPPNGYRNAQLGSAACWLGYRRNQGHWSTVSYGSLPHTG